MNLLYLCLVDRSGEPLREVYQSQVRLQIRFGGTQIYQVLAKLSGVTRNISKYVNFKRFEFNLVNFMLFRFSLVNFMWFKFNFVNFMWFRFSLVNFMWFRFSLVNFMWFRFTAWSILWGLGSVWSILCDSGSIYGIQLSLINFTGFWYSHEFCKI